MNETRLSIVPDEQFSQLLPRLNGRLALVGQSISAANFLAVFDGSMKRIFLQALKTTGASEGSIWLVDSFSEFLTIAYNSGPHADVLAGRFKQPVNAGLISMVFATQQPFLENEVYKNTKQAKTLDSTLHVKTDAMIAVPFSFLDACRGVASCVILTSGDDRGADRPRFTEEQFEVFQLAVVTVGRLVDLWALRRTIGLD